MSGTAVGLAFPWRKGTSGKSVTVEIVVLLHRESFEVSCQQFEGAPKNFGNSKPKAFPSCEEGKRDFQERFP